jgi:hypothetical protein
MLSPSYKVVLGVPHHAVMLGLLLARNGSGAGAVCTF